MAKPRKRTAIAPQVSLGGIVHEESLPLPFVYYPNHYGTFFAFGESEDSEPFLCECSKEPLAHLATLNTRFPSLHNTNPDRNALLDSFHVPDSLAKASQRDEFSLSELNFKERLCHRCNLVPPTRRYCHEMYGGKFKQSFGWYINQAYLRLAIKPLEWVFLDDVCPEDYKVLLQQYQDALAAYQTEHSRLNEMVYGPKRSDISADETTYWRNVKMEEAQPMIKLRKEKQKLQTRIRNNVENIVRQEFGFKKVGEGWVSETMLSQIIERLFPSEKIIRHHRPEWLEGLELDIYLPELELGIEYQGQQHYHPIKAWGGERALRELKERDERKKVLCHKLGVTLIEVDYTEPLTDAHITERLKGFL